LAVFSTFFIYTTSISHKAHQKRLLFTVCLPFILQFYYILRNKLVLLNWWCVFAESGSHDEGIHIPRQRMSNVSANNLARSLPVTVPIFPPSQAGPNNFDGDEQSRVQISSQYLTKTLLLQFVAGLSAESSGHRRFNQSTGQKCARGAQRVRRFASAPLQCPTVIPLSPF
jgi:hypothetical protein